MNLSIVSITFNNYDDLVQTYESVKKHLDISTVDFFVVNGGSCEKTKKFLQDENIHHLSEPDDGISDAFNKGLAGAKNDNIIFLNSGDFLVSDEYIIKAVNELENNKDIFFVYGDIIFRDQYAGSIVIKPHGGKLGKGMPYPHQSMIYRKAVFKKVGNFKLDYHIAMDFEHVCRIRKAQIYGKYVQVEKPSIVMDGLGISQTGEARAIKENKRALIENGLMRGNILLFYRKVLFFFIRVTLVKLGFIPVLRWIKHIKYRGHY